MKGIRAFWVNEDPDRPAEQPARYVSIGRLLMPLIGPPAPEPKRMTAEERQRLQEEFFAGLPG